MAVCIYVSVCVCVGGGGHNGGYGVRACVRTAVFRCYFLPTAVCQVQVTHVVRIRLPELSVRVCFQFS